MRIAKKKTVKPLRKLTFEWIRKSGKTSAGGVYRLWFGDKFYIGRTRCLVTRMSAHLSDLNAHLAGKRKVADPALDYYQKIIKHLKSDKKLSVVRVQILQFCKNDDELVATEQKCFDRYVNDKNCLNFGFIATPYKAERNPDRVYKQVSFDKPIEPKQKKEKSEFNKLKDKYKVSTSSKEKLKLLKEMIKETDKFTIKE